MRSPRRLRLAALVLVALLLSGCSAREREAQSRSVRPSEIADQEDPVCGMLVREQSAPRGQARHRDGTPLAFCSLGDMLVHLAVPSAHGSVSAVFVEVLTPEQDPLQSHTGPHPWLAAEEAAYVVGVERQGIMGAPVLAYANTADAEQVAARHRDARVLDYVGLRAWWKGLHSGHESAHAH